MKIWPAVFAVLIAAPLAAQTPRTDTPLPPHIAVNGDALIEVAPDHATVRLGIVRQSNTALGAQEQASSIAQEILKAVEKLGVRPERIQTSRLTLFPVYAPQRPEGRDPPRIAAYNASNVVSVDLDNLSLVGSVIDAGLTAGANQLEGVHFSLKNDLPSREQALRQAAAEARRKADAIADALGVRVVGILEVTEGGVSIYPVRDAAAAMAERTLAAPTPVSPGQIEVRASVVVRYRIEPK